VLDWYTVLCGVVAVVALGTHGAHYLVARTAGEINARAHRFARWGTIALPIATLASLAATLVVRPGVLDNFRAHPVGWLIPLAVAGSLGAMAVFVRRGREWAAFGASSTYLATMLGGGAFALFPTLLPSSDDPARALTIDTAATGSYAMNVAARWWFVAFLLVLATFTYLYRTFRGKITAGGAGYH
jgi:cytochrome d ubiquinol oxidase subunit II